MCMKNACERVIVNIADLVVMHNPVILVTVGLGSCVGIAIRDPAAKFGSLSHIILPCIKGSKQKKNPLKFADSAIEKAVEMLLAKGCSMNRLEAKIAGGASMFKFPDSKINIGERNVEAVRNKLKELGIPLLASDTGGSHGRTIEYHVHTGVMVIRTAFHVTKVI